MKHLKLSASAIVGLSVLGFAHTAVAQDLFVEGDIVRGNQEGAPGPICVLTNQFKHLEKVVFRFRILDKTGKVLDDKALKSLVVELPNGEKLSGYYGGHPQPPAKADDYFWVATWIVPASFPTGTFAYKAVAMDNEGHSQTWQPFQRVTSQLQVMPGDIEFKKQ
jgi:hypothetical protein